MERLIARFQPYSLAPDEQRIDVLDGVRTLCVLLVGWFHIWQQSWLSPTISWGERRVSLDFLLRSGYIWVDGMLLLSGFLLYLPYTRPGKRLPSAVSFYQRRLIRIVPSYLLCILPLFTLACLRREYLTTADALKDLAAHLTFTHNLFSFSYYGTHLNGALWTLAVEMQFYLLFPLLARAFRKAPVITYVGMTGAAFAFRLFAASLPDSSMYFNQLPAFLDVYANGFAAASAYAALRKKLGDGRWSPGIKLFFTVLAVLCLCQLVSIAQDQAASNGYEGIRQGQMARRFPLSVTLSCFMVCSACSLPALRFLLGNSLMRFLASVSFQFYIYHQLLAVQLKAWGIPPSVSDAPWQGEYSWQVPYTLLCFLAALLLAALITYLFERPIARWLKKKLNAKA